MSNFVVALMLSAGIGTWIYNKMQRRSGGITQNSIIGASAIALLILIISWSLLSMI